MSAASTGTVFSPGMLCITRLIEIGDGGAYTIGELNGLSELHHNDVVMVLWYAEKERRNS